MWFCPVQATSHRRFLFRLLVDLTFNNPVILMATGTVISLVVPIYIHVGIAVGTLGFLLGVGLRIARQPLQETHSPNPSVSDQ